MDYQTETTEQTGNVQPPPFGYVVFDPETGQLVESCYQVPPPAHEGRAIPVDEDTRASWLLYRANAARDGVELIPTPAPTEPPQAVVVGGYMAAVQLHMDNIAVTFGYDNLLSVVSYADEPSVPRYQAEGQAFRTWRSQVWAYCEQVLADVQSGARMPPTYEQLIAELPVLGIEPSMPA